ncbi:oligosaccharide repeat unit polymerase [Citricoccus nitrophenolicus]
MIEIGLLAMLGVFVVHVVVTTKSLRLLNPGSIFLGMQLLMAYGTSSLLDLSVEADAVHWSVIAVSYFAFAFASLILCISDHLYSRRSGRASARPAYIVAVGARPAVVALVVLSVLISTAYFAAVGYNVLLEGLGGSLSSDEAAQMRKNSYSGEQYFFPGYVNQFKNSLLPALVLVLVVWAYSARKAYRHIMSVGLSVISLMFLMGTGQRGATVTVFIITVVFAGYLGSRYLRRTAILVASIGIPVFFLGSLVLGRSSAEYEAADTGLERVGVLFSELVARIVDSNQGSSLEAFRYVHGIPPVWGRDWLDTLVGLLPGASGTNLANIVYKNMYGTLEGTAPPSLWGSVYHNFGFGGSVVVALALGAFYYFIGRSMARATVSNTLAAVGMAGTAAVLGTWIAGGPEYLANTGIGVYVLLWIWGLRIAGRNGGEMADPDSVVQVGGRGEEGSVTRVRSGASLAPGL